MSDEALQARILAAEQCPYCLRPTFNTSGRVIYPHRPDLHRKRFMACIHFPECDSYVGCHKTGEPLGRLANAELRQLKHFVHTIFDPLWYKKTHFRKRKQAYRWLSEQLNIPKERCHIGMFDEDQCWEAITAINNLIHPRKS